MEGAIRACPAAATMTRYPAPPDDRLASLILDVLIRHHRVPSNPGWKARVAPGGSTDRTFSVTDPAGVPRLTVRLARPGLVDHLRDERRILDELSGTIAPGPIDLSGGEPIPCLTSREVALIEDDALPERWLLAHQHLPGQPSPIVHVSDAARERLGGCLAWLHRHRREGFTIWPSLEVQRGTRVELFHARLATLRRYRAAEKLPDAAALLNRLADITLPASAGWQETDFALCHGDLSIGNILWDGDAVALIDWEFARDGDAAEDIAYLVAEQELASETVGEIAEAYVDAGGDPWAFARLPAWLPLVALDAALWWADYHLAQGADPVTHPDVRDRLKRAQGYVPGGS
jgi:Ser/Thr protein kinase RdoA (MazF antagonist)